MFRFIKVTGNSLSPSYQEGDYVLIGTCSFFFGINVGSNIVFTHPDYGLLIKRVTRIHPSGDYYEVRGTHPQSVDSRIFGLIPKKYLVGKVLWHISQS